MSGISYSARTGSYTVPVPGILTGSLPKILEYICSGYDAAQIARAMGSDINLVALKVSELIGRRYPFREIAHRDDFLRETS